MGLAERLNAGLPFRKEFYVDSNEKDHFRALRQAKEVAFADLMENINTLIEDDFDPDGLTVSFSRYTGYDPFDDREIVETLSYVVIRHQPVPEATKCLESKPKPGSGLSISLEEN